MFAEAARSCYAVAKGFSGAKSAKAGFDAQDPRKAKSAEPSASARENAGAARNERVLIRETKTRPVDAAESDAKNAAARKNAAIWRNGTGE